MHNVCVTGCPSWYVNGRLPIKIKKTTLNKNSRILFHSDPEQRDVYPILFDMFKDYHTSQLCIQSEFDLLRFLYEDNITDYNNNYRLNMGYLQKKDFAVCFTNVEQWTNYIKNNVDLSFGLRIHGTIATLKSGKPGILVAHDGRTKEMAEFFNIPHINLQTLYSSDFLLEKIYEEADYETMYNQYPILFKRYIKFLKENKVPYFFDTKLMCHLKKLFL